MLDRWSLALLRQSSTRCRHQSKSSQSPWISNLQKRLNLRLENRDRDGGLVAHRRLWPTWQSRHTLLLCRDRRTIRKGQIQMDWKGKFRGRKEEKDRFRIQNESY
jgi:hypothetical protein